MLGAAYVLRGRLSERRSRRIDQVTSDGKREVGNGTAVRQVVPLGAGRASMACRGRCDCSWPFHTSTTERSPLFVKLEVREEGSQQPHSDSS
jgi:hypothetical protein